MFAPVSMPPRGEPEIGMRIVPSGPPVAMHIG
jgi:hypothetical protein